MRMSGGHIGLSTGRAAHERLWPAVSDWLQRNDAIAQRSDAVAQKPSRPAAAMPVAARKVVRPQPKSKKRKR
jgi:hypothetical protein